MSLQLCQKEAAAAQSRLHHPVNVVTRLTSSTSSERLHTERGPLSSPGVRLHHTGVGVIILTSCALTYTVVAMVAIHVC